MELVEGVSLGRRLIKGPLPPEEVRELGAQLMDGLRAAHAKGIVHRDLKPENLVISTEGRLKILDFGVAKVLSQPIAAAATANDGLTREGALVGTLSYMAPEQIRGQEIDARTDLYAAGAVLYEMVTGRAAYSGGGLGLVEEILTREPPAPTAVNASVPPALEMVIVKAMDKDPRRRYQSAADMLTDLQHVGRYTRTSAGTLTVRLRSWKQPLLYSVIAVALAAGIWLGARGARTARGTGIQSIAVLPLENLSRDSEQEYFADGMTDELITTLGKIEQLRVISRTSVMQYKGIHRPMQQIARELNVDALVEGTVTRAQDRVRITAKLIEPGSEKQLWGDSFEGNLKDVLSLQDQVARAISQEIKGKLTSQQQARFGAARAVNPQAYEAYLKGREQTWKFKAKSAVPYFEKAVSIDPQYAQGYAGLSIAYFGQSYYEAQPLDALIKARDAANKALALDDSLPDAHSAMGFVRMFYEYNWRGGEAELRKSIQLKPGDPMTHYYLSIALQFQGRHDEAISEAKRAIDLDPLDWLASVNLGYRYQGARRFGDAVPQFRKTLAAHPDQPSAHNNIAQCLLCQGKAEQALNELGPDTGKFDWAAQAAIFTAAMGRKDDARRQLANLLKKRHDGYYPARLIASVYAALGDRQEALRWLNLAVDEHDGWVASYLAGFDCEWDPLRGDPEFGKLKERLKLP